MQITNQRYNKKQQKKQAITITKADAYRIWQSSSAGASSTPNITITCAKKHTHIGEIIYFYVTKNIVEGKKIGE